MKKVNIFMLLVCSFILINLTACGTSKTFEKSTIENSSNLALGTYSLCMRTMGDGNSNVAGKNIVFCNEWKTIAKQKLEYDVCVEAMENKAICYLKIYGRYDDIKDFTKKQKQYKPQRRKGRKVN